MRDVIVILGSESDRKPFEESGALNVLREVGVEYEVSIFSADRHDDELKDYCQTKLKNGTCCFIGAAGLAPVLPGRIAGIVRNLCPVIGVALTPEGQYTITGKPKGTVVLTTGIGKEGLYNAALAACQIIAQFDTTVNEDLRNYLSFQKKPSKRSIFSSRKDREQQGVKV